MANVLIIDDDKAVCDVIAQMVASLGHEARKARTLKEGLELASATAFDVVFLDVRLPDGNGLEALPELHGTPSSPEVIIITGFGDPDGAEVAIRSGAWDYLEKPFSPKKIALPLKRIIQYREDVKKARKPAVALKTEGIVGSSLQMKACMNALAQASNSETNVLITGETGTGKELFARAIHANSSRTDRNFVVVDCAALPETLVESALFGYERGAYTGAVKSQDGLIKQADGGTLFLDEVGELTPSIQKSFLRVLQERLFRPLGGRTEVQSDFRLVAATNRNLDQMAEAGAFRKDLAYRLQSFNLGLPPLRERDGDIKDLVLFHMNRLCENYGIGPKGFSPDFFDLLAVYDWPGNVRELFNTIERILAEAQYEPTFFPKHLPEHIRIHVARASVAKEKASPAGSTTTESPKRPKTLPRYREFREDSLADLEKRYFEQLMEMTRGNIKQACNVSGLGRTRLYTLLKKYGVSRLGWPAEEPILE